MVELRYGFIETLIFKMCLESNTINYRGERGLTKLGRILEKGRKAQTGLKCLFLTIAIHTSHL